MGRQALLIALLGGLVNLDLKALGGLMVSQPLVAGPLVGWVLGDLPTGLVIGAFLELIWINSLPIGVSVPPNVCLSSIMAVALAVNLKIMLTGPAMPPETVMVFAIVVGAAVGIAGRWLEIHLREINSNLARRGLVFAHHDDSRGIEWLNVAALGLQFVQGFLLCWLAALAGLTFMPRVLRTMPFEVIDGLKLAWYFLPALGLAVVVEMFITKRSFAMFFVIFIFLIMVLR